jgi:hypothetical protein
MKDGYKTYTGLVIAVIGILNLTDYISPDQIEVIVKATFEIVGVIYATYGRFVTKGN